MLASFRPSARPTVLCLLYGCALALFSFGCDHGLAPPETPPTGVLVARISYASDWPPDSQLHDLRFVAMRFVPRDTSDFLQLDQLVFSDGLRRHVPADTVLLNIDLHSLVDTFYYSGVAQQFGANPFRDWRPVGLYTDGDGRLLVRAGGTTTVDVTVDFDHPPRFPP